MERAKSDQRGASGRQVDVWLENNRNIKVANRLYGLFAYHSVVSRFQQSIMDCPENLGRYRFCGLTGAIRPISR